MFITLSDILPAPPRVLFYYQARKATCLVCRQTDKNLSGEMIWSGDEKLKDIPTKHCERCGSRMFLENEIVPVLDFTKDWVF